MRKVTFLMLLTGLLMVSSCVVDSEAECDQFTPCPSGFTCDLVNGVCVEDTSKSDTETEDKNLPIVDNEVQDKTEAEPKPDNEVDDDSETLCEPDMLLGCDPNDFHNINRCNGSGTAVESVPCGDMSVCHEDKCVQVLCEATKGMCSEDDMSKVFECDEKGVGASETVLEDCGPGGYCQAGACIYYCDLAAQDHSYQGCDYFTANLNTSTMRSDPIYAITISNIYSDKVVTVDITNFSAGGEVDAGKCHYCVDSFCMSKTSSKGLKIDPGKLGIVQFPHTKMVKGTGVVWDSYHVKTDLPVTVYQFSPFDNSYENPFETSGNSVDYSFLFPENGRSYSNDASLLMPSSSVYTDYIVAAHTTDASTTYATIINVSDDDTTVTIKSPVAITAANGVPAITAGGTGTMTIKKGQVVQIESTGADITGARISCDKDEATCHPFAVFSGTDCANIPNEYGYCDHIEQQMFPVQTWGKKYVIVKTKPRAEEWDYIRIIASEDATKLTFSPNTPAQITVPSGWRDFTVNPVKTEINAGEYSEFYFKSTVAVEADKPIMVVHYLAGADFLSSDCQTTHTEDCVGDPAMMLIPPAEQFRKDYRFLTPGSYASNFATIVMTTGEAPEIDGTAVTGIQEITGTTYSYAIVDLGTDFKTHTLNCDTNPCGLFVYGWEQDVSYAYPGGLNLEKLSND